MLPMIPIIRARKKTTRRRSAEAHVFRATEQRPRKRDFGDKTTQERERKKEKGGRVEYPKQFSCFTFFSIRNQRYLWGKFHRSLLRALSRLLLFEREREREIKSEKK
jgi:hypothetical protein